MKRPSTAEEIIQDLDNLPTLPGIAMRILDAVKREESDLAEIGEILSTDPPLSAKVLKMINSPFYGLQRKITSVSHAVSLLGIITVKNLALSFSLVKGLKRGNHPFDYTHFWKCSLTAAVTCKLLGQRTLPDHAEDIFFLGLLHNIGVLALAESMPKQYGLVVQERERNLCPDYLAESQVLGFTHGEIGARMVEDWGLPESFSVPIRFHHRPEDLHHPNTEIVTLTKILYLTSLFMDFLDFPNTSVPVSWVESFGAEHRLLEGTSLEDLAAQVEEQTAHVFPLFEIKPARQRNYVSIIEEARKELIHLSSDFVAKLVEQQKVIEGLREQAARDSLTGLPNYQRFHELLDTELYRSKRYHYPVSILLVDIDHFKGVNDEFGHLAGDRVLKGVVERLKGCLRKSDTIARYGGDEFGIILPETPSEAALVVANRLKDAVGSLPMDAEGKGIPVTLSIGVATSTPQEEVSRLDLIRKSDQALYEAKDRGRNRFQLFSATGA